MECWASDSRLKRDTEGFAHYYQQRKERLADSQKRVCAGVVAGRADWDSGRLLVQVEDSGAGFDVAKVLARPLDSDRLSGRGVSLVRGNCALQRVGHPMVAVTVEFSWYQ